MSGPGHDESQPGDARPTPASPPAGDGPAAPSSAPSVSIVSTFLNEEQVLPELLRRLRVVLDAEKERGAIRGYEMVLVNAASTDRSCEVLRAENAAHGDVRLINMSRRFPPEPCIMAGMEHSRGDAVICMDADLQDPPEVIPDMIRAWREDGADVVHTVRTKRKGENPLKLLYTKIAYKIIHKVAVDERGRPLGVPVEAGDFKLVTRQAVNHLVKLKEKKPYLRGLVSWMGFKQCKVEYQREARHAGETKFAPFSFTALIHFFESALISFSGYPMQIASCGGFLSTLIACGVLIHVLIEKFSGRAVAGWTAVMVTILFLGSVQLLSLGIMGLYINRISEEVKDRPNYIIESMEGFPEEQAVAAPSTSEPIVRD